MNKHLALFALLSFLYLVACQGAPAPAPATLTAVPTIQVIVIPVVATVPPTGTPSPTAGTTATASASPVPPTLLRTVTATRASATPTKPRPTATTARTATPPAAPPGSLLDGNYSSTGSVRAQFSVSGGGTLANDGFFNFHCAVDGALETYSFANPAAIVDGKFAFSALPAPSGAPQVTMVCTAISSSQVRCTIKDLPATNKCLDTAATLSRK